MESLKGRERRGVHFLTLRVVGPRKCISYTDGQLKKGLVFKAEGSKMNEVDTPSQH